jgi:lipoyl(octanoyl) transferase
MPLFEVIDLFLDETRRNGPEQMALDEALLECVERPLLRVYRWAGEAVSFGYAQSLAEVRERFPSLPCVRRWTGGGIVEHVGDWTFSLIVPSKEPLAKARPQDTYRLIHAQVVIVLKELGCSARLVRSQEDPQPLECFSSPAIYDVVGPDQRKLCGGAQRRTRRGFLHQGSIQDVRLPADFALRLLLLLAGGGLPFSPPLAALARTDELIAQKYATMAWLARVP